jgi:tRNA (guanine9-N1)-methyltransferase
MIADDGDSIDGHNGESNDMGVLGDDVDDEAWHERQARRHQLRVEHKDQFKNAMRTTMTKAELKDYKHQFVVKKRIDKRIKDKVKKKEFLESMPEDERTEYIKAKGQKVLAERMAIDAKFKDGRDKGMSVVIDCGFQNIMSTKELHSLAMQLNYVHLRMKKTDNLYRIGLVNYKGSFVEYSKSRNIPNWWFADLEPGNLAEYIVKRDIAPSQVVYLSPDGKEELQAFEEGVMYVIGGIVDNMIYPFQSVEMAKATKVKAMKLPLDEFRKINHFRPCLNINTVFDIIDGYRSTKCMNDAILQSLPERFREEYLEKQRAEKAERAEKREKNERKDKIDDIGLTQNIADEQSMDK